MTHLLTHFLTQSHKGVPENYFSKAFPNCSAIEDLKMSFKRHFHTFVTDWLKGPAGQMRPKLSGRKLLMKSFAFGEMCL